MRKPRTDINFRALRGARSPPLFQWECRHSCLAKSTFAPDIAHERIRRCLGRSADGGYSDEDCAKDASGGWSDGHGMADDAGPDGRAPCWNKVRVPRLQCRGRLAELAQGSTLRPAHGRI